MIWFIGFLAFVVYRTFNAGMRSDSLFYDNVQRWDSGFRNKISVREFEGEKLFFYIIVTLGVGITWPLSLPCIGIYLLGKRYAK